MSVSWAVEFRPKTFDEVLGQTSTIKTLKKQLETGRIANCYLFAGPTGDGKTTLARIMASVVNDGYGSPIEIDAASNNGVDAIRQIVEDAKNRSVDSIYKVFIIDECHALSSAAWQAFLKCIEEPPQYTIFIFCTTNPEKVPETINNRLCKFNLSKVDTQLIRTRLLHICQAKGCSNYEEACDYLAKLGCGGVRDSIAYLEKCASYNMDLSINNVLECLGNFSYDSMFDLTGAILNKDERYVLKLIDTYYNSGKDLKLWAEAYLDFVLDLTKYALFKNMSLVKIPQSLVARCEGYANIPDILMFSNDLVETMLDIKGAIKYDTNYRCTIEAMLIHASRAL